MSDSPPQQKKPPRIKRARGTTIHGSTLDETVHTDPLPPDIMSPTGVSRYDWRAARDAHDEIEARVNRMMQLNVPATRPCSFGCGVPLLQSENNSWCCAGFQSQHQPWLQPPEDLMHLMNEKSFPYFARIVNNALSPAVLSSWTKGAEKGLHYYTAHQGPPAMRLSGQLHAKLRRDIESCWFVRDEVPIPFGTKKAKKKEYEYIHRVRDILRDVHPLGRVVVSQVERYRLENGMHDLCVQVAVTDHQLSSVYVGRSGMAPPRSAINIHEIASQNYVQEFAPEWETLLYPLLFPHGDSRFCWSSSLKSVGGRSLTLSGYIKSIMLRQRHFWQTGALAQQFILDGFARAEQQNISYWKSEKVQTVLRRCRRAKTIIGTTNIPKVYLPCISGSPAYQRRLYHDGLHLATKRGNTHCFITVTANPNWPEIQQLSVHLSPSNRVDAIARAFVGRRRRLMELLDTPNYLFEGHMGIDWFLMSTEWQQCGIPHSHLAIRFRIDERVCPMRTDKQQLILMDHLISAQLPEEGTDDHALVMKYMIHCAPCRACLRKRKGERVQGCRFYYPKKANAFARIDAKGFPMYRRRACDSRVVPHILRLLRDLMCHVNVEWTYHSGCIGYLYSYINKGVESSGVRISDSFDEICAFRKARVLSVAEAAYRMLGFDINSRRPFVIQCRISLDETSNEPSLSGLGNPSSATVEDVIGNGDAHDFHASEEQAPEADTVSKKGLNELGLYFIRPLCAESLFLCDFWKTYYICKRSVRGSIPGPKGIYWRKRDHPGDARIQYIPHTAGDIYFLRILLLHFSARSLDDLRSTFPSFRERTIALGLFQSDNESLSTMQEAIESRYTSWQIRQLFVQMCHSKCSMVGVWSNRKVRTALLYDFLPSEARSHGSSEEWSRQDTIRLCVVVIANQLINLGSDIEQAWENFDMPPLPEIHEVARLLEIAPRFRLALTDFANYMEFDFSDDPTLEREFHGEINLHLMNVPKNPCGLQKRITNMQKNQEQLHVFNRIRYALENKHDHGNKLFHIDAPAGCGKTYVCGALLESVRMSDDIGLACATTGVASINYLRGMTGHSLFQFPVDRDRHILEGGCIDSKLLIALTKGQTNRRIVLIRAALLIVWDEVSMLSREILEALDRLLRVIMDTNVPFGGKVIVTVGDMRQLPPVDAENASRTLDPELLAYATSTYNVSVLSSPLWSLFTVLTMTFNERSRLDPALHASILSVGNGDQKDIYDSLDPRIKIFTVEESAMKWLYEDEVGDPYNPTATKNRAMLCSYNADVDAHNEIARSRMVALGATVTECLSSDSYRFNGVDVGSPTHTPDKLSDDVEAAHEKEMRDLEINHAAAQCTDSSPGFDSYDFADVCLDLNTVFEEERNKGPLDLSIEHLNMLGFPNVPPHRVRLCTGMLCMLLRNLDSHNRLMNGTRVMIKSIGLRLIEVIRAEDLGRIDNPPSFLIPRIAFFASYGFECAHNIQRRQFPLRQCSAITIHKSQAQTLDRVVVDLRDDVFEHGMLYVALSRVRCANDICILLSPGQTHIRNVVLAVLLEALRSKQ